MKNHTNTNPSELNIFSNLYNWLYIGNELELHYSYIVENHPISAEVNGMMSFTISTAEVSPFLSVLRLFAMPTCRSTRGIIFWDVPKGGFFSSHSMFDTVVAAALLLLFMLTVIPLHPPLAPDEIRFDSVIRLRSHKPIHCGTLLCKLMRSPQRTMPLHHLHNQTFRSAAIRSETRLLLLCHLYWKHHSLAEDGFYSWILIPCARHTNITWLLPCLWQINLDSATCLLLDSLFITRYTILN